MKREDILAIDDPELFNSALSALRYNKPLCIRSNHPVAMIFDCGSYIIGDGFPSIFFQCYNYNQLSSIIDFWKKINCNELADRFEQGRDVFYQGRADLKTFDDCRKAGFTGEHLNDEQWEKIYNLEEGIVGADSLMDKMADPLMRYIKAHPKILDGLVE